MKRCTLLILIITLGVISPALALDTLGVTDTTGMGGITAGLNGYHVVGWISTYVYTASSTDTVLDSAFVFFRSLGTSCVCTAIVSVYDSATGTLQAQSNRITGTGLGAGEYLLRNSISGNLSPGTKYKIGIQFFLDAGTFGRIRGIATAGWGDVRNRSGQGLTPPANLSSHTTSNESKMAAYVTAKPGSGGAPEDPYIRCRKIKKGG